MNTDMGVYMYYVTVYMYIILYIYTHYWVPGVCAWNYDIDAMLHKRNERV